MTLDNGVFAFAKEYLITCGDREWYIVRDTSEQAAIPRPPTGKPNRRIVLVDAPIWLYEIRAAKTFDQLLNIMAKRLEFYLTDDLVNGVIFLCDNLPPEAKQCTSARDPTEDTPATPLELVTDFVGTEHDQRIEAWVRWSQQPDRRVNGPRETQVNPSDLNQKRFDFELPAWQPSEKSEPERYALMDEGKIKPPFMDDYLKNADFKKMLYLKMLEGLITKITVPFWYDHHGKKNAKWVVLQGTGFEKALYPNGTTGDLKSELQIDYREADTVIGHYMRLFTKDYDLIIESTDGDCTMCALLAMDDCVTQPTTIMIKNVQFSGRVYHVRHRWKNHTRTQIIDVCEMWKAIHNTFAAMSVVNNFRLENPVATFVALSAMLTNDYVIRYKQIGASRLYKAVVRHSGLIFASGDLVHNSWKDPGEFKLNWETFKRLSVAVWTDFKSVKVDITHPDTALAQLEKEGTVANRNHFSLALVKRTFANLTWCLRYFNTAGHAKLLHPNEFSTDANGVSIFGYVKDGNGLDKYGRVNVSFAKDVAIESLI
jgi:hypothetical protein